jgi:hypothetical protein
LWAILQTTIARTEIQSTVSENQQIPAQLKSMRLTRLETLGDVDSSQSMPDIVAIATENGVPQEMLPQIAQLSNQISYTIRTQLTEAFDGVFPWVAGIVGIGIIPAALLRQPKPTLKTSSRTTGDRLNSK